jgi:hypothetical protein
MAQSTADCAICQRLETELERMERDHAEKLAALSEYISSHPEYRRLRIAEEEARQVLETLQGQIHEHKRTHKRAR